MSTSTILGITVAEPVFLFISGYIFAKFAHFLHDVPNKQSSSIFACLLVILHAAQVFAEFGAAWCATSGVMGTKLNLGLNITQVFSVIVSVILVQIHYSTLVYFMIKRRTCWLVVASFLTIFMTSIFIGIIIFVITTKGRFDIATAIDSKNPVIRNLSRFFVLSYCGGNMLFDGSICFMISFHLIRSGCLDLGKRMRTVVRNLLLLTFRTFLLTTLLVVGLAVVTLTTILPQHPNPQLVKRIPLIWRSSTSIISRVYVLSFFSSFVGKSNRDIITYPSPQFLNSFKIEISQLTQSDGETTTNHYPQGPRLDI
ncbi:uncharacterized protein MELLADRAFT_71477 [Melampsora larici-populina 98AG31]|uniref:Uncharacterized protein n=1 Tax=Melampsora larici-populina (strain 98AG31 / pathotype 3-4-7) TaxID=747676 RepID=F4RH61_MELLP|nr:uncharacterized protein MELLADRAFT_71477 [Melampsora larici-populina 98AG31]EGG08140.1 hypothetical protein MELLADRAFT_71477 [Melampsora larici-populina 98AG31]